MARQLFPVLSPYFWRSPLPGALPYQEGLSLLARLLGEQGLSQSTLYCSGYNPIILGAGTSDPFPPEKLLWIPGTQEPLGSGPPGPITLALKPPSYFSKTLVLR